VLLEIGHRQHRPGLEKEDGDAEIGEDLGDGPSAGSGADDDDVVNG
jgi:hypothetical protein